MREKKTEIGRSNWFPRKPKCHGSWENLRRSETNRRRMRVEMELVCVGNSTLPSNFEKENFVYNFN
jgi:hypothetical protein